MAPTHATSPVEARSRAGDPPATWLADTPYAHHIRGECKCRRMGRQPACHVPFTRQSARLDVLRLKMSARRLAEERRALAMELERKRALLED